MPQDGPRRGAGQAGRQEGQPEPPAEETFLGMHLLESDTMSMACGESWRSGQAWAWSLLRPSLGWGKARVKQ